MADEKITQLTETTTPETNDLLAIVVGPNEATPISRSVSILNLIGTGWNKSNDAWAYASATTITVPSGAASIYSIGDKIKLTQTTVKYFYIVGVADTVLTVTGGSDYAVANAAITSPYYSKASSPVGFPQWFNLTGPTWTSTGTAFTNQPTNVSQQFNINGRTLAVQGTSQAHATSGGTGIFIATFTAGQLPTYLWPNTGSAMNLSAPFGGYSYVQASEQSVIRMAKYDGTALFTNSQYAFYSVLVQI